MAGAENAGKPVCRLRLLVDKKKNKVVLAESGKEFIDVLFSFLTLPMGTIVRLVEKYEKNRVTEHNVIACFINLFICVLDILFSFLTLAMGSVLRMVGKYEKNQVSEANKIGCFNNLYKSVLDIGTANFMTKACQDMLLFPRGMKENQRKLLKLNVDDTETLKYFMCPKKEHQLPCRYYSNFCSSKCFCGEVLTLGFNWNHRVSEEEVFVSDKLLFTITDDLRVGFSSTSHIVKKLKVSGYSNVDQLYEINVDVDHEKVLALLHCLFTSDTPLTDVFLSNWRSRVIPKVRNMPNLCVIDGSGGVDQSNKVMSVRLFARKIDKKVIHIESEKEFVDLLLTFLVLPLNTAWKLSGSHLLVGCIDNLGLSSIKAKNALENKYMLPCYYSCQHPLLDVCYEEYRDRKGTSNSGLVSLKPMDPTSDKLAETGVCNGFLKRDTTFIVSDDLTITPMDLSSTICSLKKLNMSLDDIEEQVINITKAEAIRLLRASFVTTNALNTVFQSLLLMKPKEEKF